MGWWVIAISRTFSAHADCSQRAATAHARAQKTKRLQRTTQVRPGRWQAAIDVAGEVYHAYFTNEEDAADAIVLSGLPGPAAAS